MKLILCTALVGLIALPAMAEKNPQPKPSGITIHLFGPELITTSNSSANPSSPAAPSLPNAVKNSGGFAQSPASPSQPQPAATTYSEPSLGQVLHEMFVTGDPAQDGKPSFSKGRQASSP